MFNLMLITLLSLQVEFVDLDLGLSFKVKEGYNIAKISPQLHQPFLYLGKPEQLYPNVNFVFSGRSQGDEQYSHRDELIGQLKSIFENVTIHKVERLSVHESGNGLKIVYSYDGPNNKSLTQIQYHFNLNGFYLIATGSSISSKFVQDLSDFEEILFNMQTVNAK